MATDGDDDFARLDDYSRRMPSPPRIHVPPSYMDGHALPKANFNSPLPGLFDGMQFEFKHDTANQCDWTYEQRHKAQKILPFLYLGPRTACKDRNFLVQQDITMVLAFRHVPGLFAPDLSKNSTPPYLQTARDLGIRTREVECGDCHGMVSVIPTLVDDVNDNLHTCKRERGSIGNVLVICESGNDRAAFFTIAYVMHITDLKFITAIQLVHASRFCINVPDNLRHVLAAYHDKLTAQRQVADASAMYGPRIRRQSIICNIPTNATGNLSGRKRSFQIEEVDEDQDIDMEQSQNQESVRPFAPFRSQ